PRELFRPCDAGKDVYTSVYIAHNGKIARQHVGENAAEPEHRDDEHRNARARSQHEIVERAADATHCVFASSELGVKNVVHPDTPSARLVSRSRARGSKKPCARSETAKASVVATATTNSVPTRTCTSCVWIARMHSHPRP